MSKKNVPSIFLTCKYVFLNIWKKNISKKIVPGIFRLVSMLFEIFEKGYEQKKYSRCFQISKYPFSNICKRV